MFWTGAEGAPHLDSMTTQQELERKFRELHDYVRHIFQMFVGWFTFFATVNYATMGWLAKPSGSTATSTRLGWVVSLLFISQNLLGIVACFVVRRYLLERDAEAVDLERQSASNSQVEGQTPFSSSVPAALYSRTIGLMAWALGLILVSWCAIPVASR
jgi:hypothetical protein